MDKKNIKKKTKVGKATEHRNSHMLQIDLKMVSHLGK